VVTDAHADIRTKLYTTCGFVGEGSVNVLSRKPGEFAGNGTVGVLGGAYPFSDAIELAGGAVTNPEMDRQSASIGVVVAAPLRVGIAVAAPMLVAFGAGVIGAVVAGGPPFESPCERYEFATYPPTAATRIAASTPRPIHTRSERVCVSSVDGAPGATYGGGAYGFWIPCQGEGAALYAGGVVRSVIASAGKVAAFTGE
jgi:hypothetical protein